MMAAKKRNYLWFIYLIIINMVGLGYSFLLKNIWPLLSTLSVSFVIMPRWWSIVALGFAFTAYYNSGWPLMASLAFLFVGKPKRWWPIPAGIAFALVEILSFYLSERPLGITRGFTVMGAIISKVISPAHAEAVSYWGTYEPVIDWTMALILGVVMGSFASSRYSGDFKLNAVPQLWKQSKGDSVIKRWFWTFVAGIMMGFAARVAGGCVSGLLISGTIQLAPSGFIFMFSLWIGGLVTTFLFYRTRVIVIKREQ
jgi:hypothetical protein